MNDASLSGPSSRLLVAIESLALAATGFLVMSFLYAGSVDTPGAEIGVPEHDSFYHIRMALMMPEHGLLREFPWLQYAYFTRDGSAFVSHHFGFQVYLIPFVHLSQWLTGDPLPGARWATATCFGLNLMLFNLLLRQGAVPMRGLWIVLFLLLPDQFFGRHAFIRAIGLSLAVMQFVVLLLFRGRWVVTALAIALYIQVYLGGVMYVPVIVAAYALGLVLAPADERRWPIAMIGWSIAGWLGGIAAYPYRSGMLDFLKLQVLGSGLSPDIEVGLEWRPYTDAWFLVRMSAVLLGVWTLALVVRTRIGPKLDARETALLIISFVYLLLTLKARRFIEYWPLAALLSAAYMSRPVLALVADRSSAWAARFPAAWRAALITLAACIVYAACAWGIARAVSRPLAQLSLAEWQLWVAAVLLLALAPLAKVMWDRPLTGAASAGLQPPARHRAPTDAGAAQTETGAARKATLVSVAGTIVGGIIVACGCAALVVRFALDNRLPQPRLPVPPWAWIGIAALYGIVPLIVVALRRDRPHVGAGAALGRAAAVAAGMVVLFGATGALAATKFGDLAKGTRCYYDLPEIRRMMAFVRGHSEPGDIIFTDDWDIFPVYFYVNPYNHYVVGLDPKFTHERRPDLWARYVRITRGETPARSQVAHTNGPKAGRTESIDIDVIDIREHFKARWAIVDSDHRRFASKLVDRPDLAELVYPCTDFDQCSRAKYWVFRMREPGEVAAAAPQADPQGFLYLSRLWPISHTQGYGNLQTDRTVDERGMQMRGISYPRGVGTHAPSISVYAVPPGYDAFEAVVGVDDETDGLGTIVAEVWLDGRPVYRSPVLTGRTPPVTVYVPLNGANQLLLKTETTDDGNRFDHVDWGEARFVRSAATRPATPGASVSPPPTFRPEAFEPDQWPTPSDSAHTRRRHSAAAPRRRQRNELTGRAPLQLFISARPHFRRHDLCAVYYPGH